MKLTRIDDMALAADSKSLYIPLSTIYGSKGQDGSYNLSALDVKNLNDNLWNIVKKIQGNLTLSDLTSLTVEALTAVTVITQNLYATYGDISELTVDRLLTDDKVAKYWASDTSDSDHISIQGKYIKFVTGSTTGATTQHTDRSGNLLYYHSAVTAETYKIVGMTTTVTDFPVMVYAYTEYSKAEFAYFDDGINKVPRITMGAGSGVEGHPEYGKGFIWKDADGLTVEYITPTGEITPITLTDFVDAKMRRLESCAINKTTGTVTVQSEGSVMPIVINYVEGVSSITYTWPDSFVTTVSIT